MYVYDVIWRRIEPFFPLQQLIVGVFSDCMHWPVIYVPVGRRHDRWSIPDRVHQPTEILQLKWKHVDVMLADKEQISTNCSGYQHTCLFLLVFFFFRTMNTVNQRLAWWAVNFDLFSELLQYSDTCCAIIFKMEVLKTSVASRQKLILLSSAFAARVGCEMFLMSK